MAKPIYTLTQIVEQIRDGDADDVYWQWGIDTVSYSTNTPAYTTGLGAGYLPMSAALQLTVEAAFELWDDLTALTLNPSVTLGDIALNYSTTAGGASTSPYDSSWISGNTGTLVYQDIWIEPGPDFGGQVTGGTVVGTDGSVEPNTYGFLTLLHEIGHALGFDHPGPYNGSGTYNADAVYAQDTLQFSVMSYWAEDQYDPTTNYLGAYPSTPMLDDIAAIQAVYGADLTTRTNDTVYGFNSNAGSSVYDFTINTSPVITIWDADGVDTIDVSNGPFSTGHNQIINLNPGSYSSVGGMTNNLALAFAVDGLGRIQGVHGGFDLTSIVNYIENAIGGLGNDTITGNDAQNMLDGGAGNDQLDGGNGVDTLIGGTGNDSLDGGTGTDAMAGGTGNDTYFVDNAGDVAAENSGEGTDTVNTTVSYTLPSNFETLVLVEGAAGAVSAAGNGVLNWLYGNSASNTLFSYGGDDVLLGGGGNDIIDGGVGDDAMAGGTGDDTFYVDSAADSIFENASEGIDTVYSTISYTLANNFETLFLVEGAAGAVSAAGNGVQNFLYGNSGNNTLFSYVGDDVLVGGGGNDIIDGGVGNDTMAGGTGNDTYYVDSQADTIIENAGEGSDTVFSIASFTLPAEFEILFLVAGAAGAINGAGNSVANQIYGNALGNALSGKGGADTLVGGAGNDLINGGAGVDLMHGGADNDTFVFASGEANGDTVLDFNGNGAAAGDSFQFTGFGTAAQGATFTQIGVTNNWQIHSGLDAHDEIITLDNGASVHASDYVFV